MSGLDRRSFLKAGLVAAAGAAVGGARLPAWAGHGGEWRVTDGPYGPLRTADANGVMLPAGFRSRIVATGESVVEGTAHVWHRFPDGGATYPAPDGGWVYVSNSEVPLTGGVGALRFGADGTIVDGYRVLTGSSMNCAGGPTPWGTWLSCEEHPFGRVWECDPQRPGQGQVRPALGTFSHEAVAVDPVRGRLYLTEDDGTDDGDGFYRFTPDRYPDLSSGRLEVASVAAGGAVRWLPVDPLVPASAQRPVGQTAFDGAEGCWYEDGHVYFTTKSTNRVWDLDTTADRITVHYDAAAVPNAPLTGVDNMVMSRAGDLVVAEDGGNMELVLLTPEGEIAPLVRVVGHDGSELAGPAFDPSGSRLYFSSQRGGPNAAGVTFEVSGPFRAATRRPARAGLRALRAR